MYHGEHASRFNRNAPPAATEAGSIVIGRDDETRHDGLARTGSG